MTEGCNNEAEARAIENVPPPITPVTCFIRTALTELHEPREITHNPFTNRAKPHVSGCRLQ